MTRNVKFKMSIQGFSFEFEGSEEAAQNAQDAVSQSLAGLANIQGRLIDASNAAPAPALPFGAPEATRQIVDSAVTKKSPGRASRSRRPRGEGCRGQINKLLGEGFFDQQRQTQEVKDELDRRSHPFEVRRINEVLSEFTSKDIMDRERSGTNWLYRKKGDPNVPASG